MLFVSPTLPIFCLHAKQIHLSPTRSTSLFFLHSPHLEIEIFILSSCICVVNKDISSEEWMISPHREIFSGKVCKFFRRRKRKFNCPCGNLPAIFIPREKFQSLCQKIREI